MGTDTRERSMERLSGTYKDVYLRIESLIEHEDDLVAAIATIACEIHQSFPKFHWTGFYRHSEERDCLVIGPYQGSHGCLRIPRGKGVCGAAALRERRLSFQTFTPSLDISRARAPPRARSSSPSLRRILENSWACSTSTRTMRTPSRARTNRASPRSVP